MSRKHYHKGTQNSVFEEGCQPEGWELGMYLSEASRKKLSEKMLGELNPSNIKSSIKGKICINNGTQSKFVSKDQVALYEKEGWVKGGLPKSPEHNLKNSLAHRGDKNAMRRKEVSAKAKETFRLHHEQGLIHSWNKGLTKELDERVARNCENSLIKRLEFYKNAPKEYWDIVVKKRQKSLKDNQTYSKSKPENRVFEFLCSRFNKVDRQYPDYRYPFACDFYLSELDMFIECNFTWFHGPHPFDSSCEADVNLLERWNKKKDNHPCYSAAINTWLYNDIKKFNTAIENNLNYLVFYTEESLYKFFDEEALQIISNDELLLLNKLENEAKNNSNEQSNKLYIDEEKTKEYLQKHNKNKGQKTS